MDKPEFRVERRPATTDEAFAIGMAKLLEREGRTIAAAELRRLHAENAALHQANEAFSKRQEWWNEKMFALEQQRGVLLEALRKIGQYTGEGPTYSTPWQDIVADLGQTARAAIKAVEGENHAKSI